MPTVEKGLSEPPSAEAGYQVEGSRTQGPRLVSVLKAFRGITPVYVDYCSSRDCRLALATRVCGVFFSPGTFCSGTPASAQLLRSS